VVFDVRTGEFVCGPLRAGGTEICIWRHTTAPGYFDRYAEAVRKTVAARGGAVTRVELESVPAKQQKPAGHNLGYRWPVSGRLLLADGRTPAYGARVVKFIPGNIRPVSGGVAGPDGKFAARGMLVSLPDSGEETNPPGSPAGAVLVAWLPGRCGGRVMPLKFDEAGPVEVRLPPERSLRGRVTVSGGPAGRYDAPIRVVAHRPGRGKLSRVLDVRATAGHDGSFVLEGLTAGKYLVQAALDGVWLSKTVEIQVGEARPEPLRLDVLAPGGPVTVKVTGDRGWALPGAEVRLDPGQPPGPLRDAGHPASLRADGAGRLRLEGLPAGECQLRVKGVKKTIKVKIPPLR
jgi:hypothetical protein